MLVTATPRVPSSAAAASTAAAVAAAAVARRVAFTGTRAARAPPPTTADAADAPHTASAHPATVPVSGVVAHTPRRPLPTTSASIPASGGSTLRSAATVREGAISASI